MYPGTNQFITDDHGQAILPQYHVMASVGEWRLFAEIEVTGNLAHHCFRIARVEDGKFQEITQHPDITLAKAKVLFQKSILENDLTHERIHQ